MPWRSTLEVSREQDEGFPGAATQYLPSWPPAFLFDHVCMLHTTQMKQMKQVKQTANRTRFKKPTSERDVLPPLFIRERYGKASVSSIVLASTNTPWQIAPTTLFCLMNSRALFCNTLLSKYWRMPLA